MRMVGGHHTVCLAASGCSEEHLGVWEWGGAVGGQEDNLIKNIERRKDICSACVWLKVFFFLQVLSLKCNISTILCFLKKWHESFKGNKTARQYLRSHSSFFLRPSF